MCYNPVHLDSLDFPVPCGKCSECMKRKVKEWSTRILSMLVDYEFFFFTLTYTEKDVPRNVFGDMVVCRKDITDFLKRLRISISRHIGKLPIKYFICSEYSPDKLRPHYHGILFVPRDSFLSILEESRISKAALVHKLRTECFHSWSHSTWAAFDFRYLPDSSDSVCVASYVSKYMTYGKILPQALYEKASYLFAYAKSKRPLTFGFALDNQHNIDSFRKVCSYTNYERALQKAKMLWINTFYPPCFIAASHGIGLALCKLELFDLWDHIMESVLRYDNAVDKRKFCIDEIRQQVHLLFVLHDISYNVRSVPKYVREKYKSLSPIGHHFKDICKLLKELNIIDFDISSNTLFVEPVSIYDRRDYIDYKQGHCVSL